MITEKQSIKGTVSGKQSVSGKLVTSPSIDDTLTKEGCAADAKATGDAIKKAQTQAVNDAKAHTNNHATDTNNPHAVTRSQIGAAPDGFGLGVGSYTNASTSYTTQEELDALVCNGFWAYRNANAPLVSADANTKYVKGITIAYSQNHETQIGWCVYTGTCIVRERKDGTWLDWEFVNPPMSAGIEYRTTERSRGMPVYARRIEQTTTTTSGANDHIYLGHGIANFNYPVRWNGLANAYPMPLMGTSGGHMSVNQITTDCIVLRTYNHTQLPSTYRFDLYYTKTT